MTYEIIASGSTGNAVLLDGGTLVDIGVPYKRLKPYIKDIRLVLLTHQHGDHFNAATARTLHKERPAVRWGCGQWMVPLLLDAGIDQRVIDVLDLGKRHSWRDYKGQHLMVIPQAVPHDVPNLAYSMVFPSGETVFFCTDCSTLEGITAQGFDLYMIEANHSREEIDARIEAKRAAGEYAYEVQARRNHLSQEQALDWLSEQMGPESKYMFLHQHKAKEK